MAVTATEKAMAASTAFTLILDQHIKLTDQQLLNRRAADIDALQQVVRARRQLTKQRTQLDAAINEIGLAHLDLDTRLKEAANRNVG